MEQLEWACYSRGERTTSITHWRSKTTTLVEAAGSDSSTKDARDQAGGAGFIARDASEDVLAAVARAVNNDGDDDARARKQTTRNAS